MKFNLVTEDPLKVLSSTKPIVNQLQYITIHPDNLEEISTRISAQLDKGLGSITTHFGKTNTLKDYVQLIFLEDCVNFCFWAEKGRPKWKVAWPNQTSPIGGWYGLTKCFQRALAQKIPILNAEYIINLNLAQTQSLFENADGTVIPLLKKRLEIFQESGKILHKKYKGQFINALEEAEFNAIHIVKLLIQDFSSFRDITYFEEKDIYFLKRAQICAQDFSYITSQYKTFHIINIESLTAFADYKVPQMLREFGVISYTKELAEKIDNYVLIPHGSREEVEIRSVTIWCIELIRQKLQKYTACDIDNAIWLISQDQTNVRPYHRTYTMYY